MADKRRDRSDVLTIGTLPTSNQLIHNCSSKESLVKNSFLIACAIACLATPAFAQSQPPQSGPAKGASIAAVGGMTFGTESDKLFGGEIGIDATRNLTVYGTAGRMQNVAPKYIQDELDGSGFTAKLPTTFAIGGVKYRVPTSSSVRPYALAGAGAGSIKLRVTEAGVGDVTNALAGELGVNQGELKTTKFLFEMGGGVEIPVGPIYVDTGYRFGKFLDTGDDALNVSRAYVGLGYRFGGNTK
jgi:hypothetical protein